jgi:hypothetical protein
VFINEGRGISFTKAGSESGNLKRVLEVSLIDFDAEVLAPFWMWFVLLSGSFFRCQSLRSLRIELHDGLRIAGE